jgi:hypothetical protein
MQNNDFTRQITENRPEKPEENIFPVIFPVISP